MKIGITSTVPSEVVLAAGNILVDLNNMFVGDEDPSRLVAFAERAGFPHSCCGWIRGIYGAAVQKRIVDTVIAVTGGDCSNTHALAETLSLEGVRIIPFSYPYERSSELLRLELEKFCTVLGTTLTDSERVRREIEPIRKKLDALDILLAEGKLSARRYHALALSSSDFEGDIPSYCSKIDDALDEAYECEPNRKGIPIALIGVPPIISDLFEIFEELGLRVVYDEIPREFAMRDRGGDIVEQYLSYTYPYGMIARQAVIADECAKRGVKGFVHYTQTFCFRAIEDLVLRRMTRYPVLTIEGDEPSRGDARLKLRIESFAEMLKSGYR